MPGMMETILDVGLNDASVLGLAKVVRQRALRLGLLPPPHPDVRQHRHGHRRLPVRGRPGRPQGGPGRGERPGPGRGRPGRARRDVQGPDPPSETGEDFPQSPAEQLHGRSSPSSTPGTANAPGCTAAANTSPTSWAPRSTYRPWSSATSAPTPAAASPSPATRPRDGPGVYGDYLADAQGEDVVAGIRNTVPLTDLADLDPASYDATARPHADVGDPLPGPCDIEFTIERGRLWMLQTRVGKRTAEAAFAIAAELADEGLITPDESLARVSGDGLARLMFPRVRHLGRRRRARARAPGLTGCGRGRRGVRLRRSRPPGRHRGEGRPRTPGDHPRRPAGHDRRAGGADQPRRQDQPRGRGRPGHGQGLRVRRRGARPWTPKDAASPSATPRSKRARSSPSTAPRAPCTWAPLRWSTRR